MPSYATIADLTLYGTPVALLANTTPDQKNAALSAASAKADTYLGSRFHLPLISWDEGLKMEVVAIAGYLLISGRGYNPESGADTNIRARYEDALKWLKGVSDGVVTPTVVASAAGTSIDQKKSVIVATPTVSADGTSFVASKPTPRGW